MSAWMVRRVGPSDIDAVYRCERWAVHPEGFPCDTRTFTLTKRGALKVARRWERQAVRASKSYRADPPRPITPSPGKRQR